jgi:hypothetical protein
MRRGEVRGNHLRQYYAKVNNVRVRPVVAIQFNGVSALVHAAEKIYQFTTQPKWWMGLVVTFLLLSFFVSGVRGTFAYRRFTSLGAKEMSTGQGV